MSKDSHFTGQPVYSQVLKLFDKEKILQISCETKGSEAYVKRFDGFQHLVVMLFGILKHFDSLRLAHHEDPLSRSYRVNLPSSLTMNLSTP